MMNIRKANERGKANFGWLDSSHTFSFGHYHDPAHMGFGPLRVINEDRVKPGAGFDTHGHRDMEIISYVLDGALAHKDSIGTGSVIRPGEVQRMTAGSGILHSEFNDSDEQPVHFLQIWIQPATRGLEPGYEQKAFPQASTKNRLALVASPDGSDGSVTIHQDVLLFVGKLDAGTVVDYTLGNDRCAWIQVARGSVVVNGTALATGDGLALEGEEKLDIQASENAEVLLFDMTRDW